MKPPPACRKRLFFLLFSIGVPNAGQFARRDAEMTQFHYVKSVRDASKDPTLNQINFNYPKGDDSVA